MTTTYKQVSEKRDALEHWVRFLEDLSSGEWTDYLRSLFDAGSNACSMDEDNALAILNIVEGEVDRARAEFIEDLVSEYKDPAAREVYDRLCETGVRAWPVKPTNADVRAQLERCGDGTDAPWHTDELVKLAKMLRTKGF